MRVLLFSFFTFQFAALFSQIVDVKVLSTEHDTIYAKALIKTLNGNLAEERFYRTLRSEENIPKEDFFMKGERPYYKIDSVIMYSYSVDWELDHVDTIYDSTIQYEYTKDELTLERNSYFLEGRIHCSLPLEIGLRNGSPQDYIVYLKSDESPLKFIKESGVLPNRSIKKIAVDVTFVRGRNEYYLKVMNSNGSEKFVSIETVGYDLIDDDFASPATKQRTKKIQLEGSPDVYLEVKGNYKLLTIINSLGEQKIPVSQLINPISRSKFTKGKNILQLQNLNTGAIKECRVKIR